MSPAQAFAPSPPDKRPKNQSQFSNMLFKVSSGFRTSAGLKEGSRRVAVGTNVDPDGQKSRQRNPKLNVCGPGGEQLCGVNGLLRVKPATQAEVCLCEGGNGPTNSF